MTMFIKIWLLKKKIKSWVVLLGFRETKVPLCWQMSQTIGCPTELVTTTNQQELVLVSVSACLQATTYSGFNLEGNRPRLRFPCMNGRWVRVLLMFLLPHELWSEMISHLDLNLSQKIEPKYFIHPRNWKSTPSNMKVCNKKNTLSLALMFF